MKHRFTAALGASALVLLVTGCGASPAPAPITVTAPPVTETATATATATETVAPPPTETVAPPPTETASPPSPTPKPSAASPTPKPKPKPTSNRVVVPDMVGENYQDAQDRWRAAGLVVAPADDATGATRLPLIDSNWYVVSQDLEGGSKVAKGSLITATVKKYTDD